MGRATVTMTKDILGEAMTEGLRKAWTTKDGDTITVPSTVECQDGARPLVDALWDRLGGRKGG